MTDILRDPQVHSGSSARTGCREGVLGKSDMGSSLEPKRLYTPVGPRASSLCPLSQCDNRLGFYYFRFGGCFGGGIFVLFWGGLFLVLLAVCFALTLLHGLRDLSSPRPGVKPRRWQ